MISSVTVTYNPDIDCFKAQLQSLQYQLDDCVIVDNGSKNVAEIEGLCQQYQYDLIKLNTNRGLSYAQNIGIEDAISRGANYLLLLDQDSVLGEDFIMAMSKMRSEEHTSELQSPS